MVKAILPLAVLLAAVSGPAASPALARAPAPAADAPADSEVGRFARCRGPARLTCVVDGDTFWYRGEKIRLADINAPEVGHPHCPREAALGEAASQRLAELLNAGAFTLAPNPLGRNRDRYGRLLRAVTRRGASLGATLSAEGLAERWRGYRGNWC